MRVATIGLLVGENKMSRKNAKSGKCSNANLKKIPLGSDECMKKRGFTLREKYPPYPKAEARKFAQMMLNYENKFAFRIATTITDTPRGAVVKIWKV